MIKIIKDNLPPSSRSFHYLENITNAKLEKLLQMIEKQDSDNRKILSKLEILENKQAILEKKNYYYMESLIKDGHKTTHDARTNMFKNLPKAEWSMRLCQLANAKLISELDKIMKKNKLDYWVSYGSLVGAIVLNGPMPWDDDMDICMTRGDLEKLRIALKDNDNFQVTVVYDWYVKCIQYRFCSRNVKIPSFIDIAVWDYGTERTMENEMKMREIRREMMEEFDKADLKYWTKKKVIPEPSSGFMRQSMDDLDKENWDGYDMKKIATEIAVINKIFDKYREKAKKYGIITDEKKAKSLVYAFNNMMTLNNRRTIYEREMIFPVKRVKYENFEVSCPHDSESYLNTCYNDWPYLIDNDEILERSHFNPELLAKPEIQNAMYEFIGIPRLK